MNILFVHKFMFLQFLINNVYNFYFFDVLNDFSLHIFCIYFMLTYFGFIFFPYKFFVWNDKGEWGEHDGHVGECALAFRRALASSDPGARSLISSAQNLFVCTFTQ